MAIMLIAMPLAALVLGWIGWHLFRVEFHSIFGFLRWAAGFFIVISAFGVMGSSIYWLIVFIAGGADHRGEQAAITFESRAFTKIGFGLLMTFRKWDRERRKFQLSNGMPLFAPPRSMVSDKWVSTPTLPSEAPTVKPLEEVATPAEREYRLARLLEQLKSDRFPERLAAVRQLGKLGDRRAIPTLRWVADHGVERVTVLFNPEERLRFGQLYPTGQIPAIDEELIWERMRPRWEELKNAARESLKTLGEEMGKAK